MILKLTLNRFFKQKNEPFDILLPFPLNTVATVYKILKHPNVRISSPGHLNFIRTPIVTYTKMP